MCGCNCTCNQGSAAPVKYLTAMHSPAGVPKYSVQRLEFHPSTLAARISACVSTKYENGRICVEFPIVGSICFSLGLPIPHGTTVKVCMETCGFRIGVPPFNGIRASIYANDIALWTGVIWGTC
jgi:hypothetical protein